MRALIVDDDPTCRLLLNRTLAPHGRIDEAANGWEAIMAVTALILNHRTYDLICLDVMMPDLDGFGCLERIRRLEREAGILPGCEARVAMTTALDDYGSAKRAFANLAEFFFIKPFELKKVVEDLRSTGILGRPDRAPGGFDGEVLVVAAEPAAMVETLARAGYHATPVESAVAALAKVRACGAPLAVLDAGLPEVACGDLICDLLELRSWMRIAVVYQPGSQPADAMYQAGAMVACAKPLGDGGGLVQTVDDLAQNLAGWRRRLRSSAERVEKAERVERVERVEPSPATAPTTVP